MIKNKNTFLTTRMQATFAAWCFDDSCPYPAFFELFHRLVEEGWEIGVADNDRGYCRFYQRTISIPAWVYKKPDTEYWIYYLAHEMAHAKNFLDHKPRAAHGPEFMAELKRICPAHLLHYETSYKPANALYAGIVPADF
jgi:hypothetical protein